MTKIDAVSRRVQQDEPILAEFSFKLPAIGLLLLGGLVLRLILATLPGFGVDIGIFQFWSTQLAEHGPWEFYDEDFFTDYAPGYMYVLLFIGELDQLFDFNDPTFEYVLKMPAIVADLASAYLIYKLLELQRMDLRLGAAALYLVFPATLLIGPIWGQVDSVLAALLLLSIYYIGRDRPLRGAMAFTLGFLVKPQAIAALPFLAIWIMRRHPPEVWVRITAICLGMAVLLIVPFFTYKPWELIEQLYNATNVENYRVNSFWAYNFWNIQGIFESGFKPDSQTFIGISHRVWGFVLFGASTVAIIVSTWRAKGTGMLALGTALSIMAFYLFLTRMHERYIFPAALPLLIAAVLLHSRLVWAFFVSLATLHFINLYHVYVYDLYNEDGPNPLKIDRVYSWLESGSFLGTGYDTVQVFSLLMVLAFPVGLLAAYLISNRSDTETQLT